MSGVELQKLESWSRKSTYLEKFKSPVFSPIIQLPRANFYLKLIFDRRKGKSKHIVLHLVVPQ